MKTRAGKGFTFLEMAKAGITKGYARSIGISYDPRRKNRSQEPMDLNVNRLKDYISKLILYPRNYKKPKKNEATQAQIDVAETLPNIRKRTGPLANPKNAVSKKPEKPRKMTEQEKHRHIFYFLRKVQRDQKLIGKRTKRAKKREEKAAKAKDK
jgi:large subunit ribosomal protein L13e